MIFVEVEKQLGSWSNSGECIATGDDPTCGQGNQSQKRTCIDGTNDICTAADTVQTVSCTEAGSALPDCVVEKQLSAWTNIGDCEGTGEDPTCGPGNQKQSRTCTDGTADKCTDADREKTISCIDAGTALPECP